MCCPYPISYVKDGYAYDNPRLQSRGHLPAGVHETTWSDFVARFGFSEQRRHLLIGLCEALSSLQSAGGDLAYMDGSFVTTKENPRDFDVCWSVAGVDPDLIGPVLLDFDDNRSAMIARFGGDLFPAELPNGDNGETFLELFQIDRDTGKAKGIVLLRLTKEDLEEPDMFFFEGTLR